MTTFTPVNEPFLKYLNVQKTPYIFLTAETDDFDDITLQEWSDEGFIVTYVPLGNGGAEYTRRLHATADAKVGISDRYAIVGTYIPTYALQPSSEPHLRREQLEQDVAH